MSRLIRPIVWLWFAAAGLVLTPSAGAAQSHARQTYPATARIVVAPVTSSGQAAAGYHVQAESQGWAVVDCSYPDPSPGAVSPNIELCSPSAAYAIACWKAAATKRVLCTRDPSSHELVEMKRTGKFAPTKIAKPRDRAPLLIVLTDGTRCQIRVGGAWGQPKGHPNLYGAYSCDRHGAAWLYAKGSYRDPHAGIDESHPSWRIRTGNGGRTIVWRHIAEAYFVATAP